MTLDSCLQSWQYGVLALSALGLMLSIYVILARRLKSIAPGVGCGTAWKSPWASILYFRNETWALLYYLIMGVLVVSPCMLPQFSAGIFVFMLASSLAAVTLVAYLIFVQWRILKRWCGLCVALAIATLALFASQLMLFW